jgi:5,10-methylenetetrahydromethanopterin reductase
MIKYAKLSDERGFESIWMPEDYFLREAIAPLTCFTLFTKKIKCASGIVNPFTRNPVIVAITMAALDELSNGRAILGLGTGARETVEKMGIPFKNPLVTIRESVHVIRQLLGERRVTFDGVTFKMNDVRLGFKPVRPRIPIYIAAVGPKMLQLAGEIGDGVLLTAACSPEYVKYAVENVKIGAERADRDPETIDVASHILYSVSEDLQVARNATKKDLVSCLYPIMLELSGFDKAHTEPLLSALKRGSFQEASKHVSDDMVDAFTASGSPERCQKKLKEYEAAGVTLPIVNPIGQNIELTIETVGKYIA